MASKKKRFFFFLKNTKTNSLENIKKFIDHSALIQFFFDKSLVTLAQHNQKIFVIKKISFHFSGICQEKNVKSQPTDNAKTSVKGQILEEKVGQH